MKEISPTIRDSGLKDDVDKQTVKIDNLGREVSKLYTREDIDRKIKDVYDVIAERRQKPRNGE